MGHIAEPAATVKSGIAKISGGAQQYGIPTRTAFSSQSTSTLNANEVRYIPIYVDYTVTLNAWQLEVTTAMGIRTIISSTPIVAASLGASALVQRLTVAQTFGAFPNPGTAWTTTSAGTGGLQHFASWQWTE